MPRSEAQKRADKKYHDKTLSNAEVDYLNSIKIIEKKLPLTKDKKDEKNFR